MWWLTLFKICVVSFVSGEKIWLGLIKSSKLGLLQVSEWISELASDEFPLSKRADLPTALEIGKDFPVYNERLPNN
ncbi:hypothetical protein PR048_011915, partial [Dryococelus australis]